MTPHAGKLYLVLIVSVLLSCVAALIIAGRYRRRMQELMCTPHTGEFAVPLAEAPPDSPAPLTVSLTDNRRAGMRLTMLMIALSFLLSVTSTCIWWALSFPGEPMPPKHVAIMALLHLWPMVPALALIAQALVRNDGAVVRRYLHNLAMAAGRAAASGGLGDDGERNRAIAGAGVADLPGQCDACDSAVAAHTGCIVGVVAARGA